MLLSHKPLEDSVISNKIFTLLSQVTDSHVNSNGWDTKNYIETVVSWMQEHPSNTISGWNDLPHRAYSVGSVDAINSFIYRHGATKRLRFSRAEFVAAKISSQSANFKWAFLEDGPVKLNDALLISVPFSGSGNLYEKFDTLLDQCEEMDVPVFLDLSYWPISRELELNIGRHCIKEVTFSLSKPLATQLRLGMRMTRDPVDDMLQVNSDLKIYNRIAVWVGIQLMNEFSIDYLLSKYVHRQIEVCNNLGLIATNTFTLAQGDQSQYAEFNRNGYNRICITDEITKL